MTAIETLICGCPLADVADGFQHQPGCWMGEVETVAREAASEARSDDRAVLPAVLNELFHEGYLHRDVSSDDVLLGVLDHLAEVGLLAAVKEEVGESG